MLVELVELCRLRLPPSSYGVIDAEMSGWSLLVKILWLYLLAAFVFNGLRLRDSFSGRPDGGLAVGVALADKT